LSSALDPPAEASEVGVWVGLVEDHSGAGAHPTAARTVVDVVALEVDLARLRAHADHRGTTVFGWRSLYS